MKFNLLSGPRSVWCVSMKENFVVKNKATKKMAMATTFAPMVLNAAISPSDTRCPSNPPGGIAPRTSGICQSVSRAGTISTSIE